MTASNPITIFNSLLGHGLSPSVAFAVGWSLLGWAKLSELNRLPESADIKRILQTGVGTIGDTLSKAVKASDDQLLGDLLHLRSLPAPIIETLIHAAWEVVRSGDLDNLSVEEFLSLERLPVELGESLASQAHGSLHLLPPELITLIVALGDLTDGDTVYTPWDTYAQLAVRARRLGALPYIETPSRQNVTRLVQLLANFYAPVHYTDPVAAPTALSGGELTRFDVALACPPIGMRYPRHLSQEDLWRRFPEHTSSSNVLVVRHLLSQAKRRVVVLVPSTLLSGAGAEAQLREDLVRKGIVQAVLAMPKGLLSVAGVATAVLVLDPRGGHRTVRFIDVANGPFYKAVSKTRWRLIDPILLAKRVQAVTPSSLTDEAIRTQTEVLEANTLQVSRHLAQASVAFMPNPSQPLVCLADLVHTVRPLHPTLRKSASSTEPVQVLYEVGVQDLSPHGYIRHVQRLIELPDSLLTQAQPLYLKPLDIVLIVKGSVGKVGIVPSDVIESPAPWIVGQSGIVLRMNMSAPVDARALFLLLRSSEGQTLLQSIVVGATTPLIQLRELMALAIRLPDSLKQAKAIEALRVEDELQHQIDQLRSVQANVAANLWGQP